MPFLLRYVLLILSVATLLSCGNPTPVDSEMAVNDDAPEKVEAADQPKDIQITPPETVVPEAPNEAETHETPPTEPLQKPVENKIPTPERAADPQPVNPAPVHSPAPAAPADKELNVVVEQPTTEPETSDATAPPGPPSHAPWQAILKTYVDDKGRVNYTGLKQHEKALDAYLVTLAETKPNDEWTRNQRLAYWLNAYNAFTFKLILDNYPTASITKLHGGKPWDVKWIKLYGKTYSLNDIEHEIIRPRFKDPRIHFAVVCAAESCPPLANEAFNSRNLNGLLDTRARQFINNTAYNKTTGNPQISKIFEWYAGDFGDVKAYLNKYLEKPIPADAELGYMDYDWSLNEQ